MMGDAEPREQIFHAVTLSQLVPDDHPLRKIRPLVDTKRVREFWRQPRRVVSSFSTKSKSRPPQVQTGSP